MAQALADAGACAVYSYAGRTDAPRAQPLPLRVGGFGGADGLAQFLRDGGFTHVIDATHPFAAQISKNAIVACAATKTALIALQRPEWLPGPGDRWLRVADTDAAIAALPDAPARVFLAIGRQGLAGFVAKPQHHYLLRLVDAPQQALPLPDATVILARGPFDEQGDMALLRNNAITHIVAKNAGGAGAEAKLRAACALSLPVVLIDRPALPARHQAASIAEVMAWLAHARTDLARTDPASTDLGV